MTLHNATVHERGKYRCEVYNQVGSVFISGEYIYQSTDYLEIVGKNFDFFEENFDPLWQSLLRKIINFLRFSAPPFTPTNVRPVKIGTDFIQLTWDHKVQRTPTADSYNVYIESNSDLQNNGTKHEIHTNSIDFNGIIFDFCFVMFVMFTLISDLKPDTKYSFTVKSKNHHGVSIEASQPIQVQTLKGNSRTKLI